MVGKDLEFVDRGARWRKQGMKLHRRCVVLLGCGVSWIQILLFGSGGARAEDLPREYKACVSRGLEWLAQQQALDGHWGQSSYPGAVTALCGMAFLMEGSTCSAGKYSRCLRRCIKWLVARNQRSGSLVDPGAEGNYMFGHGYAMLFLASVYGEESDGNLREKLQELLTRAVSFAGKAQNWHGGWSYVSAADDPNRGGGDSSATVALMQGLRAARGAGIVVPKEIIDKGLSFLRHITGGDGGVYYGWNNRNGTRLPLTAAALASSFSGGQYNSDLVKNWIKYCEKHILGPAEDQVARLVSDQYLQLYLAQVVYNVGDDRYEKLFPDSPPDERLIWSKYRKAVFDRLKESQATEGCWHEGNLRFIGFELLTAMSLITLQLDNGTLPIYQR